MMFSSLSIDPQNAEDDMQFITMTDSEISKQPSPSPMRSSLFKVLKKSDIPSPALSKQQTTQSTTQLSSRSPSQTPSTELQDV